MAELECEERGLKELRWGRGMIKLTELTLAIIVMGAFALGAMSGAAFAAGLMVVDGDTARTPGPRSERIYYRVKDLDAPEVKRSHAKCDLEIRLGKKATKAAQNSWSGP